MNTPPYIKSLLLLPLLCITAACSGSISPAGLSIGIGGSNNHVGIGTAINIPLGHTQQNSGINTSEQTIIGYFTANGQIQNQPVAGGYFRQLLAQPGSGLSLVQDFYSDSGKKRSDPMLIDKNQLKNLFAYPTDGSQTLYYPSGNVQTQTQYQNGHAVRSQSWPEH